MPFILTDLIVDFANIEAVEFGYSNEEVAPAVPAIVWLDLDSNDVTLAPDWSPLTVQGTVELRRKQRVNGFDITIANQAIQLGLAKAMLHDPTATGIAGVSAAYGFDGRLREKDYALRMTYPGAVKATGAPISVRYLFHRIHPFQYLPIAGAPAIGVPQNAAMFNVKRATTDLLGAAILGLKNAAKGDYFQFQVLA